MAVLFCVLPRSFFEKSSIEEDQERPRENSVTTIAENELQKKNGLKKTDGRGYHGNEPWPRTSLERNDDPGKRVEK